jgi:hypothetical protein
VLYEMNERPRDVVSSDIGKAKSGVQPGLADASGVNVDS